MVLIIKAATERSKIRGKSTRNFFPSLQQRITHFNYLHLQTLLFKLAPSKRRISDFDFEFINYEKSSRRILVFVVILVHVKNSGKKNRKQL